MSCRRIGLTGGIACGKTTVSNYFHQLGVPVLDADVIGRELVEPEQAAWQAIRDCFGDAAINPDQSINRAYLRQLVFANVQARKDLESILHPRIRSTMLQRASILSAAYCLLSIPLLVETQQMDLVERILVVDCSPELQRQRLAARDNLSTEQINRMLAAQVSREERLRYADDILDNSADTTDMYNTVVRFHQLYSHWASPV